MIILQGRFCNPNPVFGRCKKASGGGNKRDINRYRDLILHVQHCASHVFLRYLTLTQKDDAYHALKMNQESNKVILVFYFPIQSKNVSIMHIRKSLGWTRSWNICKWPCEKANNKAITCPLVRDHVRFKHSFKTTPKKVYLLRNAWIAIYSS